MPSRSIEPPLFSPGIGPTSAPWRPSQFFSSTMQTISASDEGEYLGEAAGLVIRLDNDRVVYFAGDTCLFGDMQLIRLLHEPDYAVLPIGDHFTMGPREAAAAIDMLGRPAIIPCHWGTFPLLTGTPEQLIAEAPDGAVIHDIRPGDTVELV